MRGCPAGEDAERVPRGGARSGAVGDDGLPGIGRDLQGYRDVVSGKPILIADGRALPKLRLGGVTPFQLYTRAPRAAV